MKKVLFLFLLILFFLQYSFVGIISNSNIWSVGLIVGFVVSVSLKDKSMSGLIWAIGAGLLADYFSNMNLGTFVIIFIILVGMIEIYKTKFAQSQNKYVLVLVSMLIGVFLVDFLIYLFMETEMFFGKETDNVMLEGINFTYYFIAKAITALTGVAIYKIIDRIYGLAGRNFPELKVDNI